MPWKNGGGETAEIAIAPPGAALEAFDWRLSMAHVAADGPFSAFAGVDRTLCVLSGTGLRLRVAGRAALDLTTASAPYAFPADAATEAALLEGPILDLNVMTRRGRARHAIERVALGTGGAYEPPVGTAFVILQSGAAEVAARTGAIVAGALDALQFERGDAVRVVALERTVMLVIEIDSSPAASQQPGGG